MTSPRERLLQSAREVVATDGLEGLTLRAIARRAEDLAAVLWSNVHGLVELTLHGGLAATVGPDAADRLPGLSTTLALGLDEPVDHLLGPPPPDPAPTSLPQGVTP